MLQLCLSSQHSTAVDAAPRSVAVPGLERTNIAMNLNLDSLLNCVVEARRDKTVAEPIEDWSACGRDRSACRPLVLYSCLSTLNFHRPKEPASQEAGIEARG